MTAREQSLQEWLAEERKRLNEGFTFEPEPRPEKIPTAADDILVGLGLGAGVLAGAAGGHSNPATFEGCRASTIAEALRAEFTGDATRVEVSESEEATMVRILHSRPSHPHWSPALTVTLIETGETLTVAMSDLSPAARRGVIGTLGRTAVRQSRELLLRRRGLVGMLDTAGNVLEGVEDVSQGVQSLNLPKRVWSVIDRVGQAAESAYLEARRRREAEERRRRAAERAWTHCEWCGRAFGSAASDVVQCPSCGAPRGSKPEWLP